MYGTPANDQSDTTLLELMLPQSMILHRRALPEITTFQEKEGRLRVRFTKRVQGSHEILMYYIQQYRGFATNSEYHDACS